MELSEKLQELRKEKGLTQEEPADELLSGGEIPKFADEDKERRKISYNTYLESYKNNDGTVNWLPACGEVDTIVANKALFEKYNISLPTDYGGFIQACR